MRQPHVLIYAKPPRIGLSKTRLARSLGNAVLARRIAVMTLARTMKAALGGPWRTILYSAPDAELETSLGGLWPVHLERRSQGIGDLTDRLNKGLRETPPGPVLFIGADTPDISAGLIRQATCQLRTHDAVFGPASDGGFWLFGLNTTIRTPSPFAPVRWSGPHAMADVHANLASGSKVALLPELIDIDDAADWQDWRATK